MSHHADHTSRRRRVTPGRRRQGFASAPALACALALALALTLAGCGGASHHAAVASLPSHGGGASSHHASAGGLAGNGVPDPDSRPREQLNDTATQEANLYDPYLACLRAHRYVDQQTNPARLAVAARCEHLEPLAPWPLDPSNPQARAFIGRTVSCLQARGYHARAVLVTTVPIQPPEWFVRYSPKALNYAPRRPESAEDACHEQALK